MALEETNILLISSFSVDERFFFQKRECNVLLSPLVVCSKAYIIGNVYL
jgi:hypothetical protein